MRDFAPRCRTWLNATNLTDDAKHSLHDILMLAADELVTLAEEVDGRGAADHAANHAETAPLIHDDLSIPDAADHRRRGERRLWQRQ
jgi:hypothetical protein